MVTRIVLRTALLALTGVVLHAGCAGRTKENGGETNWLASCQTNADCSGTAECLCGVCTSPCEVPSGCPVEGAACIFSTATGFAAHCPGVAEKGVCLRSCTETGCPGRETCTDGFCLPAQLRDAGAEGAAPDPRPDGPVSVPEASVPGKDAEPDGREGSAPPGECTYETIGTTGHCVRARCEGTTCEPCAGPTPALTDGEVCNDDQCDITCHRIAVAGERPVTDGGVPSPSWTFRGVCPPGSPPHWDFLTYRVATPGASSVIVRLDPDPSFDGGPNRVPEELRIGSGAGDLPDDCSLFGSNCPVLLGPVLGDAATDLLLDVTFERVPAGGNTPTVEWVEARYSCLPQAFTDSCEYEGRTWAHLASAIPGGCTTLTCHQGVVSGPPIACTSCDDASGCVGGAYCDRSAACGKAQGVCSSRPATCDEGGAGVCGCDGETYANACLAAKAGVSVDYPQPCRPGGGCWDGELLEFGDYGTCACKDGEPTQCIAGPHP